MIDFTSEWFDQPDVDTGFGVNEKKWLKELIEHGDHLLARSISHFHAYRGGTDSRRYRYVELFNRLHIHMCGHQMVDRPQVWYMVDYANRFLGLNCIGDGTEESTEYYQ